MTLRAFKERNNLLHVVFPEDNWASERRKLPESKVAPEGCVGPANKRCREHRLTVIIILNFGDQKENH